MASNNAKITRETREVILDHFLRGEFEIAQRVSRRHGLADNYPSKLARARGLVPRSAKWWGQLRERA